MRFVSALALLAILSVPTAHAQAAYQASLIGGNEVPAVTTPADGIAKVFIDGTTVTVSGSFTGLTSEYVASHIHRGTPSENGPVALALTAGLSLDKTEGSWEFANNTFTVTQALADSIANGLAYVNLHTTGNPAGEIRGQIVTSARTADALIVGVFDGPLTGGQPKAIELHFRGDVPDLSRYAVGSANNGDGSDGPELVLPAGPVALGTFYTIADNAADFTTYFGVAPDAEDGVAAINGDDAIELYYDADDNGNFARTEVVDVFGEIAVDGTGQVWEYTDGWAYRKSGTNPGGDIFFSNAWTYSGLDANDGKATNVDPNAFPIGTYSPIAVDPTARLQVIHNAPDLAADTVDIYVNDALFLDNIAFREASAFTDVPAGVALKVDITDSNAPSNQRPVFTGAYTLDASSTVQLIATGVVGTGFAANPDGVSTAFTLLASTSAQETSVEAGKVDLRVIHGAPDAPTVDVRSPTSGPDVLVADDIAFTDVTGYAPLDPASYVLNVTTADGLTTVASYEANLSIAGGNAITVLASGFLTPADDNNGPAFALVAVFANGTTSLLPVAVANEETARAAGMDLRVANPIASSTPVTFDAGVAGRVELAVYDALGRRVAELVNETTAPGPRTAELDASALAPGAYVLRLTGEAGTLTRTLTVVR
ncbi:MAG: hypothetical protein Rubg2KO_30970 [Rubricoccaceae bacterium]